MEDSRLSKQKESYPISPTQHVVTKPVARNFVGNSGRNKTHDHSARIQLRDPVRVTPPLVNLENTAAQSNGVQRLVEKRSLCDREGLAERILRPPEKVPSAPGYKGEACPQEESSKFIAKQLVRLERHRFKQDHGC